MNNTRKTQRVHLRVSEDDLMELDRLAKIRVESRSTLIRAAIKKYIKEEANSGVF